MRLIIFVIFISFLHNALADTYHYTSGPNFPLVQANNSTCTIDFWMPVGDITYTPETAKCTQSQTNNYHYTLTAHSDTTYTIPYSSGYCTGLGNLVLGSSLPKIYTFSNVQPDGSCTITSSWGASTPNSNTPTQLGICNAFSADFDYPGCIASLNTTFDQSSTPPPPPPTTSSTSQCPLTAVYDPTNTFHGYGDGVICYGGCLYDINGPSNYVAPDGTLVLGLALSTPAINFSCDPANFPRDTSMLTTVPDPAASNTAPTTPPTTDVTGTTQLDYSGYLQHIADNTANTSQSVQNANSSISGKLDTANNYLAQIAANSGNSPAGPTDSDISTAVTKGTAAADSTIADLTTQNSDLETQIKSIFSGNTTDVNLDNYVNNYSFFGTGNQYPTLSFSVLGTQYNLDTSFFSYLFQLIGALLNITAAFLGLRIIFTYK